MTTARRREAGLCEVGATDETRRERERERERGVERKRKRCRLLVTFKIWGSSETGDRQRPPVGSVRGGCGVRNAYTRCTVHT